MYLPRWYPNRYDPMPGLFIERHARSVAAHAEVSVLYVHPDGQMNGKNEEVIITRDEELMQVKIYYPVSRCRLPFLRSAVNLWKYFSCHRKGLKLIIKEKGRPALVHVNVLTRLGVLAMIYKWCTGTPYVITEHWTRYLPHMDNFRGALRKMLTRMAVRQASAVLPVTKNLQLAMERHGLRNRNYRIIPNVVDTGMFRVMENQDDHPKKRFIHVSCFEDRQKNISGILRVLKKISSVRDDWECHMIGEGIHLDLLKDQARKLGLEGREVIFHGLKENEALAGMMAGADFQVMFSRFENLPVVILESYACGVPVLSTDVGGIREHLDPSLGILIPSEDEAALEENINYMLDHYQDFSKEHLRLYAENHFGKEVIGRQLNQVYRDILKT